MKYWFIVSGRAVLCADVLCCVLLCVVLCCIVCCCVVLCCVLLCCIVLCCVLLYCIATQISEMKYGALQCDIEYRIRRCVNSVGINTKSTRNSQTVITHLTT